jgi:hypothetical protein
MPHSPAWNDLAKLVEHEPRRHRACRVDGTSHGIYRALERLGGNDADLERADGDLHPPTRLDDSAGSDHRPM